MAKYLRLELFVEVEKDYHATKKNLLTVIKFLLCALFIFPVNYAQAHLIAITATSPFPAQIYTESVTTATYTVTNITTRTRVTVIDQSIFPSTLSIFTTTCGTLLNPGQSCTINLVLRASGGEQIKGELREWAKPSADGVRFPIVVSVIPRPSYTITPSAGPHGTISPNTPQSVASGGSLTFTATPDSGYLVNQWLVDGALAQTGGATFTLSNITANHNVALVFGSQWVTDGVISAITNDFVNNIVYIGGTFNFIGPRTGGGVPIDTTTGNPAPLFPEVVGTVNSVVADGVGGWYIGGLFTYVGQTARSNLAHLNSDNTLDVNFNPNVNNQINTMVLQGSTLYIGGLFGTVGGQTRN